jgi:putative ABC transport system permease protein
VSLSTLKLAVRVLLRRKVFTAISLVGVCLTLLVLLVATAFVDEMFAPVAPESNARRELVLADAKLQGPQRRANGPLGMGLVDRTVRDLPGAPLVTVFRQPQSETAWVDGRDVKLDVKRTDASFWRVHDFRFVEGGPYGEDDDANGRAVAVVSESARDRLFGEGDALGKTFELDGRTFEVGGVVEDVSGLRPLPFGEMWAPLGTLPARPDPTALMGDFVAVVVAPEAAALAPLRAEIASRVRDVNVSATGYDTLELSVDTQAQSLARNMLPGDPGEADPVSRLRIVLLVLAGGFMLLPALNLVNLSLSRVLERASEIGVRKAFGATRAQLVLQFVAENVLLTIAGGVLAAAVAPFVLAAIDASGLISGSDLSLNGRVLLKGLLFAVAFGILSGAWPAWRMSRLPPIDALRGRTS